MEDEEEVEDVEEVDIEDQENLVAEQEEKESLEEEEEDEVDSEDEEEVKADEEEDEGPPPLRRAKTKNSSDRNKKTDTQCNAKVIPTMSTHLPSPSSRGSTRSRSLYYHLIILFSMSREDHLEGGQFAGAGSGGCEIGVGLRWIGIFPCCRTCLRWFSFAFFSALFDGFGLLCLFPPSDPPHSIHSRMGGKLKKPQTNMQQTRIGPHH